MSNQKQNESQMQQYVCFVVHGEEYGVPILCVQEIIRYETLTRVPQSPEFIDGVLNLRGQVIPVMNLRKKFGLPPRELDKSTRIIVVEVKKRVVGIVVDEVSEVLQISQDQIDPPPPMGTQVNANYISGMGKLEDHLVILLEIDKVLTQDEVAMMEGSVAS